MDGGLLILMLFCLLTGLVLLPVTIWRIRKSNSRIQIAVTHLSILIAYSVIVLFSEDNEGAILPLPQKPVKIGFCFVVHIWIAFFHSATIKTTPNVSATNSDNETAYSEETNSTKTTISRIIIVLSSFICINPYWTIVGLPLYIVGSIALAKTSADRTYKIKWTVVPISSIIVLYLLAVAIYLIFHA